MHRACVARSAVCCLASVCRCRCHWLATRRQEILLLLAEGLPNKSISRQLQLSEDTVKTHLKALFQHLGVHTRTACVSVARQRGLLG